MGGEGGSVACSVHGGNVHTNPWYTCGMNDMNTQVEMNVATDTCSNAI